MQRTYFYSIDLSGQLWHDETLQNDADFLNFFFERLKDNRTGQHTEYPYVSPCGHELNFVRCADRPVVFHHLREGNLEYAGSLAVRFEPQALVHSEAGVLYHPAPVGTWGRLGARVFWQLSESIEERDDGYWLSISDQPGGVSRIHQRTFHYGRRPDWGPGSRH